MLFIFLGCLQNKGLADLLEDGQGRDWKVVGLTPVISNSSNNGVGVKRLVVLGLREPENMKEDRFFFFFSLLLSKTLQIHSTKLLSSPKCKTLSNNLTNSPVTKCSKQLPFTRLIRESNQHWTHYLNHLHRPGGIALTRKSNLFY